MVAVGTNGAIAPPLAGVVKGATRAEEKGYDSIWWPDHLMGWHPDSVWRPEITELARSMPNPHIFVDPVAAIAACSTQTSRIRLGTSVTDAIRRHPAMLAQEFLTLDHFSKGRTILGIGAGEGENITPYGMSFDRPVSRLEEALEIVRLLWGTTEPVDYDGETWRMRGAVCGMSPYEDPATGTAAPPPIWVGAHGPRMLSLAGRHCDGWLPTYQGGPEKWAQGLAAIRTAATGVSRSLDGFVPALLTHLVVVDDDRDVERLLDSPLIRTWMLTMPSSCFEEFGVEHPLGEGSYGLLDYIPTQLPEERVRQALQAVPLEVAHKYLMVGTPDQILDELGQFVAHGLEHVVLWNISYLADFELLRSSYRALDDIAVRLQAM